MKGAAPTLSGIVVALVVAVAGLIVDSTIDVLVVAAAVLIGFAIGLTNMFIVMRDDWDKGYKLGHQHGLEDGDGFDEGYSTGWLAGNEAGYYEGLDDCHASGGSNV